MVLLPIILLLIFGQSLFNYFGSAYNSIKNGGEIRYDEATFQAYADKQYAAEFGSSSAYEDNLLIVFLTNETADGYYTIAWVGDNIKSSITNMFGNEYTAFGRTMQSSINQTYYAYSLDSNLALVMDTMTEKITDLGLESSFYTETAHTTVPKSHVTNYTELSITEETINRALENFTEKTGIPAVIVIDTVETVFGKTVSSSDIVAIIVAIGVAVIIIYHIIRAFRKRKKKNDTDTGYSYSDSLGDRDW